MLLSLTWLEKILQRFYPAQNNKKKQPKPKQTTATKTQQTTQQ